MRGIGRANLDGTGVDNGFITGTGGGFGEGSVAVDAEHVYWTHYECGPGPTGETQCTGAIGRANLDGTERRRRASSTAIMPGGGDRGRRQTTSTGRTTDTPRRASRTRSAAPTLTAAGVDNEFHHPGPPYPAATLPRRGGGRRRARLLRLRRAARPHLPTSAIGRADLDGTDVEDRFIGTDDNDVLGYEHRRSSTNQVYWGIRPGLMSSTSRLAIGTRPASTAIGCNGEFDGYSAGSTVVRDIAVDGLTDTKLAGKASAPKTQAQSGKRIRIKVTVKAKEPLTAEASGKIKINPDLRAEAEEDKARRGQDQDAEAEAKAEGAGEEDRQGLEAGREGDRQALGEAHRLRPGTASPRSSA